MAYQEVNGIDLHYKTKGEGEPLILLHGLGSSLLDWEYQTPDFSKKYKVVALDLRGHGRSGKPSGRYSIKLFADDVALLLKGLNLYPAHIHGLSMGGATGLHLASHYPELVKSLVVANMSANMPVKNLIQKKMYYSRVLITWIFGTGKMGEIIAKNVFPKEYQGKLRELLKLRWSGNKRRTYLNALRALKNWDIRSDLHRIKAPTLIVHSQNDYTPLEVKEEYASRIENARIEIIPDAHHIVNVEKPEIYNKIINDFMTSLE